MADHGETRKRKKVKIKTKVRVRKRGQGNNSDGDEDLVDEVEYAKGTHTYDETENTIDTGEDKSYSYSTYVYQPAGPDVKLPLKSALRPTTPPDSSKPNQAADKFNKVEAERQDTFMGMRILRGRSRTNEDYEDLNQIPIPPPKDYKPWKGYLEGKWEGQKEEFLPILRRIHAGKITPGFVLPPRQENNADYEELPPHVRKARKEARAKVKKTMQDKWNSCYTEQDEDDTNTLVTLTDEFNETQKTFGDYYIGEIPAVDTEECVPIKLRKKDSNPLQIPAENVNPVKASESIHIDDAFLQSGFALVKSSCNLHDPKRDDQFLIVSLYDKMSLKSLHSERPDDEDDMFRYDQDPYRHGKRFKRRTRTHRARNHEQIFDGANAVLIKEKDLLSKTEDYEYNPKNTTANMMIHPQKNVKELSKDGSHHTVASQRRRGSSEKDGGSRMSMRDPKDGKKRNSKRMKRASESRRSSYNTTQDEYEYEEDTQSVKGTKLLKARTGKAAGGQAQDVEVNESKKTLEIRGPKSGSNIYFLDEGGNLVQTADGLIGMDSKGNKIFEDSSGHRYKVTKDGQRLSIPRSDYDSTTGKLMLFDQNGRRISDPGRIVGVDENGNKVFRDNKGRTFLLTDEGRERLGDTQLVLYDQEGNINSVSAKFIGLDQYGHEIYEDEEGNMYLLGQDGNQTPILPTDNLPDDAQFIGKTLDGDQIFKDANGNLYLVSEEDAANLGLNSDQKQPTGKEEYESEYNYSEYAGSNYSKASDESQQYQSKNSQSHLQGEGKRSSATIKSKSQKGGAEEYQYEDEDNKSNYSRASKRSKDPGGSRSTSQLQNASKKSSATIKSQQQRGEEGAYDYEDGEYDGNPESQYDRASEERMAGKPEAHKPHPAAIESQLQDGRFIGVDTRGNKVYETPDGQRYIKTPDGDVVPIPNADYDATSGKLTLFDESGKRISDPGKIIGVDANGNKIFRDDKGRMFLLTRDGRQPFSDTGYLEESNYIGAESDKIPSASKSLIRSKPTSEGQRFKMSIDKKSKTGDDDYEYSSYSRNEGDEYELPDQTNADESKTQMTTSPDEDSHNAPNTELRNGGQSGSHIDSEDLFLGVDQEGNGIYEDFRGYRYFIAPNGSRVALPRTNYDPMSGKLVLFDEDGKRLRDPGQIIGVDGEGNKVFRDDKGRTFILTDEGRQRFGDTQLVVYDDKGKKKKIEAKFLGFDQNGREMYEDGKGKKYVLEPDGGKTSISITRKPPKDGEVIGKTFDGDLLIENADGDLFLVSKKVAKKLGLKADMAPTDKNTPSKSTIRMTEESKRSKNNMIAQNHPQSTDEYEYEYDSVYSKGDKLLGVDQDGNGIYEDFAGHRYIIAPNGSRVALPRTNYDPMSGKLVLFDEDGKRLSDPGQIIGLDEAGNPVFRDDKGRTFILTDNGRERLGEHLVLYDENGDEMGVKFIGFDKLGREIYEDGDGNKYLLGQDGNENPILTTKKLPKDTEFLGQTLDGELLFMDPDGKLFLVSEKVANKYGLNPQELSKQGKNMLQHRLSLNSEYTGVEPGRFGGPSSASIRSKRSDGGQRYKMSGGKEGGSIRDQDQRDYESEYQDTSQADGLGFTTKHPSEAVSEEQDQRNNGEERKLYHGGYDEDHLPSSELGQFEVRGSLTKGRKEMDGQKWKMKGQNNNMMHYDEDGNIMTSEETKELSVHDRNFSQGRRESDGQKWKMQGGVMQQILHQDGLGEEMQSLAAGQVNTAKPAGAGSKQERDGQKWKMQGGINQKSMAGPKGVKKYSSEEEEFEGYGFGANELGFSTMVPGQAQEKDGQKWKIQSKDIAPVVEDDSDEEDNENKHKNKKAKGGRDKKRKAPSIMDDEHNIRLSTIHVRNEPGAASRRHTLNHSEWDEALVGDLGVVRRSGMLERERSVQKAVRRSLIN